MASSGKSRSRRLRERRERLEGRVRPKPAPGPAHGGSGAPRLPPLNKPRGALLCVVHLADHWAVVEKPPAFPAVPGRQPELADSIQSRVPRVFPEAHGPVTPHRLDIETSGLMVVAFDPEAHRQLSRQFQDRETTKAYHAVLDGVVEGEEGTIDLPLILDWPNRPHQKVDFEEGRPSQTRWRVLAREDGTTRVEFVPVTGRTHQLRVHAAAPRDIGGLGAPIMGDSLYGDSGRAPRMLLHAHRLGFTAPGGGEWQEFESPVPF